MLFCLTLARRNSANPLSRHKIHHVEGHSAPSSGRIHEVFSLLKESVVELLAMGFLPDKPERESRMDRLWAPWRMKYISNVDKETTSCIFCEKPESENDRENLILFRGKKAFVIMNLYPYNNGHLMVVPYAHCSSLNQLSNEEISEIWELVRTATQILSDAIKPEGFNVGMNIGRVAGAGIDQHLHMHIVPRWNGDANFMPVVGETKVISQGITEAYDTLKPRFIH